MEDEEGSGDPSHEDILAALVDEQRQRYAEGKPREPDDSFDGDVCRERQTGVVQRSQAGLEKQSDTAGERDEGGRGGDDS